MIGDIPLPRLLGMLAGLLILGIGIFVLRAKPRSRLHQLFFALAAADGLSTFAFDLAQSPVLEFVRLHAFLVYYYGFIVFTALLVAFGALFPRPLRALGKWRFVAWAWLGLLLGTLVLHGADHTAFWRPILFEGELVFAPRAGMHIVNAVFMTAVALIVLRTTLLLLHERSASHRRQGALVLGAMALGYGPSAVSTVNTGLRLGPSITFFAADPARLLIYWASVGVLVAIFASVVALLQRHAADQVVERRIVLACFGGVVLAAVVGFVDPSRAMLDTLQVLGLLAYPLILAYAIARYEVLDLPTHVQRAASISFVGAGLAAVFLGIEILLENTLQEIMPASGIVAALAAASVAAIVVIPLSHATKKAVQRIAPALTPDALELRRREVYRHALEGAAADGVFAPHELGVLARLRESLSISEGDHAAMMLDIQRRASR